MRTDAGWKHSACEALVCKALVNTRLSLTNQAALLVRPRVGGPLYVSESALSEPLSLNHLALGLRCLRSLDECAFEWETAPIVRRVLEELWVSEGLS